MKKIYSRADNREMFERLKKRKWNWSFFASGEWSESPYHQGDLNLEYGISNNKRYVAILQNGFPRRILAIYERNHKEEIESALTNLLIYLRYKLDIHMDFINENSEEIDFKSVWRGFITHIRAGE